MTITSIPARRWFLILFMGWMLLLALSARADFRLSPPQVDFGWVDIEQPVGRYQSVWVQNLGDEPLQLSYSDTGCFLDYNLNYYSCTSVGPRASCWFNVEFRPRTEGFKSCSVYVRDNTGHTDYLRLTGMGMRRNPLNLAPEWSSGE